MQIYGGNKYSKIKFLEIAAFKSKIHYGKKLYAVLTIGVSFKSYDHNYK